MINQFTGMDGLVWWQGIVEDVDDPEALGRLRIRIIGFHTDDKGILPTTSLPWAMPLMPITSASIGGVGQSPTGALPGAWVMGFFRDGEQAQDPIVWGTVYGRPNDTSTGSDDGKYPSTEERCPGCSTTNETDVNRLARGTGVSTGASDSALSGTEATQGDTSGHGRQDANQSGTADDLSLIHI